MEWSQGTGTAVTQMYSYFRLGDRRLESRFHRVMERLAESPGDSIAAAMGSLMEAKAAYRLFSHPELTQKKILAAHRNTTVKRMERYSEVLVIQDTTSLVYTTHFHAQGLGSVAQGARCAKSEGLFVHTAYALSPTGLPLGLLGQRIWSRAELTPDDELWYTEAFRWREMVRENAGLSIRAIYVCDREGDFWDLLSEIHRHQASFVIRAVRQTGRKGKGASSQVEMAFDGKKALGRLTIEIEVRSKTDGVRQAGRKEKVTLELFSTEQDLRKTKYVEDRDRPKDLRVFLVRARELNPPTGREPIDWILKTDQAVETIEQIKRVLEIYEHRWQIENFHKILKSGCQVERSRLSEVERLKKYATAMSVVAWRLHEMTWIGRQQPNESCEKVLSPTQWKALYVRTHRTKQIPMTVPTLREAIRWIAQLGGFLGRKSDGDPGTQTLWRGWEKLAEMTELYTIFMDAPD